MVKSFRKRAGAVLELIDETQPASVEAPAETIATVIEPFETFYRREFPRLLVLARALTGTAAEDVAQETMLVAYRRWAHIAVLDNPAGYVRGICVHKGVSFTRRLMVERRALRRYAAGPPAHIEPMSVDGERFWCEVRSLPRRQAQTAALFYALDLPVTEIATTLGCAEGTVKAHLSRARTALATRLGTTEDPS
jgi:RNA polymerase sigma-70 factor (ECF subfamily)